MATLHKKYNWLLYEEGTRMIDEGLLEYGCIEVPGKGNNPVILSWAKEVGKPVQNVYNADSIPWCGLYMAVIAKRAGKVPPKDPLWALNWGSFGKYVKTPMYGDVLVFVRKTADGRSAGHVGIYIAESTNTYHVLGGNQSDSVNITEISKSRLYTSRRPIYINQPKSVRRIFMNSSGRISNNEQ